MRISPRIPFVVTGATMALIMAGTAVATANDGREDRAFGFGDGPGRGFARGELGPFGPFGDRFGLGLGADGVVRSETIVDLGEAGFLTRRIDAGTVTSASDAEIAYSLANGEAATATLDEDTEVLTVNEVTEDDGRLSRRRLATLDEIAPADIPADSEVVVWSEAGDAGTFVAQRIIVRAGDGAAEEVEATEEVEPSATPEV